MLHGNTRYIRMKDWFQPQAEMTCMILSKCVGTDTHKDYNYSKQL